MLPVVIFVLQTAYGILKSHPDLAEGLLKKASDLLTTHKEVPHDDAGALAGLVAGLSAAASSAATTAAERDKARAADAAMPPAAEPAPPSAADLAKVAGAVAGVILALENFRALLVPAP